MSLKLAAKERLLWAIRQVVVPFGRVIMVVDHHSLRVISSCCSVSELMDEGVDLVELVTKRRQPLKGRTALYFLSEESESVELFLSDFEPDREIYKAAFLIFNCHLYDDSTLRKIAENVDMDRVLGCTELFLNFVAYEERVFHGNLGFSLMKLYKNRDESFVHKIASRLVSVCSVLRAVPRIRYQSCRGGIAERVARATQTLMMETLPEHCRLTNDLLVVLDRSIDAAPLFIHEYTYQACVYDVLRIPCCSNAAEGLTDDTWEFDFVAKSGKVEKRTALLSSEVDVLWKRFRHMHIQKVNEAVAEEVEKVTSQAGDSALKRWDNTAAMLNALRSMPKSRYMVEKYWVHMSLTEKSFKQLDAKRIMQVGSLEQSLATNNDQKGNKVSHSKAQQNLVTILGDVNIDNDTKARLIMLFLSVYRNVGEDQVSEILSLSGLPNSYKTAIGHFIELDLGPSPTGQQGSGKHSQKVVHKHAEKGDAYQYYKKHADSQEYELSRYMPEIMHLVTRAMGGTLEEDRFPAVEGDAPSTKKPEAHTGRLLIYVVGGISFSEMRVIYQMAERMKTEIYIGGDSIIVPSHVVDRLKQSYTTTKSVTWKA